MAENPRIWLDAREKLPLPALMRQLGDDEYLPAKLGGASRNPHCPCCKSTGGKFTVWQENDGRFLFKCFKDACDLNNPDHGHGEIGWLAFRKGLNAKDAAKEFLRMAVPDQVPHLMGESPEKAKDEKKRFRNPARDIKPLKNPWHSLWRKLALSVEDTEKIFKKRGLTAETLELMGVASNTPANKAQVESLAQEYDEQQLVELGILKFKHQKVTAAGQLIGWGRTGKRDEKGEEIWSPEIQPPLIPYFRDGLPIYVRPHKGGLTNPDKKLLDAVELADEDEEEDVECASHVWVPPNFGELLAANDGTAIFTEGEFKGMACCQTEIAALACPGITFIKNVAFRNELLEILQQYDVRNLVVVFDNELKDDPSLPGYKSDPWKQHDTQLWAEFTQAELWSYFARVCGSVKVGRLPDEYREAKTGKADFDGILAQLCEKYGAEQGTKQARRVFSGVINGACENPSQSPDLFPGNVRRIIDRKLHILRHGKRRLPFGGKPELKLADRFSEWDPEENEGKGGTIDRELAQAFRAVRGCYYERKSCLSKEERADLIKIVIPSIKSQIETAKEQRKYGKLSILYARLRACGERMKGMPKPISTCTIRGEFKLKTPGGEVVRLVRIFDQRDNRRADAPLRRLHPREAVSPTDFREWLTSIGHGSWMTGQESLDFLNADLDDDVYLRDIHAVTHCGYHKDTGIWFFADGAFLDNRTDPKGRSIILRPDDNGVYWHEGVGYLLDANTDGSTSTFALGVPKLFTHQRGQDDQNEDLFTCDNLGDQLATFIANHFHEPAPVTKPIRDLLQRMQEGTERPSLDNLLEGATNEKIPLPDPKQIDAVTGKALNVDQPMRPALETELARIIFCHLRDDLLSTVGDYDAWLALGVVLAYGFGPELVEDYYCHPGLFFVGGFGSGKSETARRLARIWGMKDQASVDLSKTTTANALIRTLGQYSSLPVFLDEYRRNSDNQKERDDLLRAATQRTQSHKATIASKTSTISITPRTSPMVAGENSPQDAATASRYVHLTFSQARRRPNSKEAWDRIKASCPHYYHLGRWLMLQRLGFMKTVMKRLEAWMKDDSIKTAISHDRVVLTIGVGFSTFCVAAEMLGCPLSPEMVQTFKDFAKNHGSKSLSDVRDETFRNRFFRDINSALNRTSSSIGPRFFAEKVITLKGAPSEMLIPTEELRKAVARETNPAEIQVTTYIKHPQGVPVVYIAAQELYDEWMRDLRARGESCPISFNNLRAELERENYWIPPSKTNRVHRQRFPIGGADESKGKLFSCWCISLARRTNDDGTEGDYLFPFAEELIANLEQKASSDE